MKKRVVVVGGGVAGVAAARAAAKAGADTTLVESSKRVGISKTLMPFILSKGWDDSRLVIPDAASLTELGVGVVTGAATVSVDHPRHKILVRDGGRERTVGFDSLVLCTGAVPEPPRIRGASKPNVFVLGAASDYRGLSSKLDRLETVFVSGTVPLALKVGEALASRGKKVEVYCGKAGLALQFSEPVAKMIRSAARRVPLVDEEVDAILGTDKVEAIVSNGSVRTCDGVVIAPRSVPSFPEVGCEKGPNGGLLVDRSMSTSLRGVYAAGDSAEVRFKSSSVPARLYSTSRVGGEVAGANAAGGDSQAYFSWAFEQEFFGLEFCSAGISESEASAMGIEAATEAGESGDGQGTAVSIVYDTATHQVYGLRIAGWRASSLAGAASMIVSLGLTVEQLVRMEFPYSPGISHEASPIALTAGKIRGAEGA